MGNLRLNWKGKKVFTKLIFCHIRKHLIIVTIISQIKFELIS